MYKYAIAVFVFFTTVVAGTAIEPSETAPAENRYLFNNLITKTLVVYSVTTTVAVSSTTRVCASTSNVTGICRRRRGIEEKPLILALDDEINLEQALPSKPTALEASAAAELPEDPVQQAVDAVSDKDKVNSSRDDDISGVGLPRSFLYWNLVTTLTSTITSTSYISAAVASKSYVILGCTPSGFSTSLC